MLSLRVTLQTLQRVETNAESLKAFMQLYFGWRHELLLLFLVGLLLYARERQQE